MSNLHIYKASAGSGKTYTLALEYIKELLIKQTHDSHRQILAVTFTKDATGEMKDRILSELYGLAFRCKDSTVFMASIQDALKSSGKSMSEEQIQQKSKVILTEILHDYSRLYITTIDSFFQKVLRNLARELGKGSKFNLEMNSTKILSEAVSAMIENANKNLQLLDWITAYIENKLEEGNNWRIDQEILNFSRCIFDEYFQEHEFALREQLDNHPQLFKELWEKQAKIQAEAKMYFQKTYREILQIIEQENLEFSDFSRNGTVLNFLKKLAEGDFAGILIGKTIKDCCDDPLKWAAGKSKRKNDITALATASFMPLLNQSMEVFKKFNTSKMITQNIHQLGLIWDITTEISKQNAENNRFMLADTALFLNRMIDDSDAPFIYEKIGADIKHVMIDEFQDTSRLQWKNFKVLLSNIVANNDFSLIVGDVKQAIYRWRNGDWNILKNIGKELSVTMKALSFNYRSEQEIIEFNNHFFTHAAHLLNQNFFELFQHTESPFVSTYDPADVIQQSIKEENHGFVSIDFIPDKAEDAKYNELVLEKLLVQIQLLQAAGIPARQICILTRKNKNIIGIAEYLASQKENQSELAAGHYLNIVSDEAFQLNSSPAIRIIVEALKVLSDPVNPIPKAQLRIFLDQMADCSTTNINLILEDENHFLSELEDAEKLSRLPLFELVGYLFRIFKLQQIEGQSNYMFTFYDKLSDYLKDFPADIYTFLKYWNDELQFKSVPTGIAIEGIRAMTIHKSKGLQFHTVILPYCDWDLYPEKSPVVWAGPKEGLYDLELLPVRYSKKMEDTVFTEEYQSETGQSWMDNINIMYVAFTRAEHNLLILGKQKKKLDSLEDIKKVSDLLQYSVNELKGAYNEDELHFEKGSLDIYLSKDKKNSDNLLKMTPEPLDVSFISEAFNPNKSIFKQSNKSREFVSNDEDAPLKNQYIAHGNVMHTLFSNISTTNDIETSVDRLLFEGLIGSEEKSVYIEQIRNAIKETKTEDWFSEKYTIYNECAIIVKENGGITTKRPDRVLLGEDKTIIIDYKFGEPRATHIEQMKQYIKLMKQMNYLNIEAFVWYVGQNKLHAITEP